MNMNTTNKVYTKNSTTTTSTGTGTSTTASQWQTYNHYKAEQGWECPRCGRINAPWVRQCDCSRGTYDYDKWTVTPTWTDDDWWKTPITYTKADANISINKDKIEVGGSDYKAGDTYVNVGGTQSNKVEPNITAETTVNNDIHNFYNLKKPKR